MPPKGYGHSLSNIDDETRAADCRVCGTVDIHRNGKRNSEVQWKCANSNREHARAAYEAQHPKAIRYSNARRILTERIEVLEIRVRTLEGQFGQTKVVSYE